MAGEAVGTVHVDQLLSNLARLYRPQDDGFISNEVCPVLPVKKESDLYPTFLQGEFYGTDVTDLVPDRSEPRFIEFSHTTERYQTQRRELGWDISDRERANADDQLRLERNKQVGTLGRLMLLRERRVAALLRKTTNGGGLNLGNNAAASWGTAGTTTIESDIWTGVEAVRAILGIRPNTIVIPAAVAQDMAKNTQLTDKLKYTYGSESGRPLLEQRYPTLPSVLFGMRVLVPEMIQNTAKEGQANSFSDVWGRHVRLLYVTPGPALEVPSVAYTFSNEPLVTRRGRNELTRVDWFVAGWNLVEKVVAPDAAYEIASA
jgi:hypothetical protein